MENQKNKVNQRGSYYLRIIGGAYLLYLVYGLLEDYKNGRASNETLILGAIFVFFAVGLFLIYTSVRHLMVNSKAISAESDEDSSKEID
mgnify:CR=1 FL=1